nr:MAG: hypothetical protein [Caudoviricetes sp.]
MINVVLRTCDAHSLTSTRIVNKSECILRCLNSIINNLESIEDKALYIIDDNSSKDFKTKLKVLTEPYPYISINFLPEIDKSDLSPKKKTRYSLQVALDYIYDLPEENLVYLVEDDYLHLPDSISELISVHDYLEQITGLDVGIFPQDFNQLYYHPEFPHNDVYFKPCLVVPTKNRYYRTTWYTQESFFVKSKIFKKYKEEFDALLTIGDNDWNWEGNTISNIWTREDFKMFMPMGSLVVHMSNKMDIPFFFTKEQVIALWEENKTYLSSEQESLVQL